jgi:hypothetical protein
MTKTIKHSYTLNYQRQYTVLSRVLSFSTEDETPFTINPYDPCIANATINGNQMTITWHVDDLKVSHVDPFQITKFSTYLAAIYDNGLVVH